MKLVHAILLALALFALPFAASAAPLVKVENGYVDWCQGFTDARAEAECIHGQFAFDWEGNLLTEIDGPGPDDDDDA